MKITTAKALLSFVAALALLPISTVQAGPYLTVTGNDMYPYCRDNDSFCSAYIGGYLWGEEIGRKHQGKALGVDWHKSMSVQSKHPAYCFPDDSTLEQIVAVIAKYLSDHPERRATQMFLIVDESLQESFPCP